MQINRDDTVELQAVVMGVVMGVVRCGFCGRKLCEVDLQVGSIRIKCKCGKVNTFSHVKK